MTIEHWALPSTHYSVELTIQKTSATQYIIPPIHSNPCLSSTSTLPHIPSQATHRQNCLKMFVSLQNFVSVSSRVLWSHYKKLTPVLAIVAHNSTTHTYAIFRVQDTCVCVYCLCVYACELWLCVCLLKKRCKCECRALARHICEFALPIPVRCTSVATVGGGGGNLPMVGDARVAALLARKPCWWTRMQLRERSATQRNS